MTPQHVYRGLLWLYPSAFRREYGEDMVEAFGEALRDDRRGRLRFWVTVVVDLVRSASRERWRTGRGVTMISRTRIAGLAALAILLTAGLMWAAWVVVTQDQGLPIEQTRFRVDVDSMESGQSARFSADTSGAPTSVRTARGEWRALAAGEELVTPVTLTIPPGPFVAQFTSLDASPPLRVSAAGESVNLLGIGYDIVVERTRTSVGFGEDSQFLSQTRLRLATPQEESDTP